MYLPCKLLLVYNIQVFSLFLALCKIRPQEICILSPENHLLYKNRETISHDQYLLRRFISGIDFSDINSVSGTTPHPTFKDNFSWGRLAAAWTFCFSPDLLSWDNLAGVHTFCFLRVCQRSSVASSWCYSSHILFRDSLAEFMRYTVLSYHDTCMKFSTTYFH